jgi:hypothetical protein
LKSGNAAPSKKMRPAIAPEISALCARSTGAKATGLPARKPRPPARSGCVGRRRSSSRETCQRNQAHRNSRKYQRRTRNWKIGMLTQAYQ